MQRIKRVCACLCGFVFLGMTCAACTSVQSESFSVEGGTETTDRVFAGTGTEEPEAAEQDTERETIETVTEEPETEEMQDRLPESWRDDHVRVRGIYVTGPVAGSARMSELIQMADETELNAMVIDVKNDDGNITYEMDLEQAQKLGACIGYIPDMGAMMAELKEHQIYTIARIVCFKDPYLASDPELALRKTDGTPVTDANGIAFVNPYREEVWEYLVDVAEEAAAQGFDEIQFDYVRFPVGEDAEQADYGVDLTTYPKEQAITEFLQYAADRLHDKGVAVGADVFGTIIGSAVDVERVGQNYARLGDVADVLSPMVYPSHYGPGVFGLEVPDAKPYETVLAALQDSGEELRGVDEKERAVVRPWLQAFTANWVDGHIAYEREEIQAQIQAVRDAGYEEWILWNASNHYETGWLDADSGE